MYIQLTTRCQMQCAHCCFACRPGVGEDMDKATYLAALKIAKEQEAHIALGGGEPTLHPEFWEYVGLALRYNTSDLRVFLVTNGANTEDALALAKLVQEDILHVELSIDEWHDPIDQRVVDAFTKLHRRRMVQTITKHGSALRNGIFTDARMCCCEDPLVHPSGRLYGCGCRKHRFGTVLDPQIPDWYQWGECTVNTLRSAV